MTLCATTLFAQKLVYKVDFTNKESTNYSISNPEAFLSKDAIDRRIKNNISFDSKDLPVSHDYLNAINDLNVDIILISKWFNSVFILTDDIEVINNIRNMSFVKSIEETDSLGEVAAWNKRKFGEVFGTDAATKMDYYYGNSLLQNAMINADTLHELGFTGEGIKIAVLDGGFMGVDTIPVFAHLYEENRILGVKDFVAADNVYAHSAHGTAVLSQMAALDQGNLIGTAPDASYFLFRTEDAYGEYLMEEYFWAAAAEYADSAGVHIINSSLGYSEFDMPSQNHTYEDMDGATTPITQAAEIAASKGILVVTSAGNEGYSDWKYITAPGDAPNVITVGAVKPDSLYAYFSSVGPTFDGRIKPDLVALGQGNLISMPTGGMGLGSGTSYASPLIAGLAACIMQACPHKTAADIRMALRESSANANNPSYFLGFGIADGVGAVSILLGIQRYQNMENILLFPNPAKRGDIFTLKASHKIIDIEIIDINGRTLYSDINHISGNVAEIYISDNSQRGIYILKVYTNNSLSTAKLFIR